MTLVNLVKLYSNIISCSTSLGNLHLANLQLTNNRISSVLAIVMFLLISSLVAISIFTMPLTEAKPLSSHFQHLTKVTKKSSRPGAFVPGTTGGGFAVQPPPGTEPLTTATANNSPEALAIAHRLAMTSTDASNTQTRLGTPCLPELSKFILPPKEARFTVIKQCVTVTGTVVWKHYFNDDGDANFNVVLDPPYKNMLGPGSYSQVFASKYLGGPAMHMEVVCQGQLQV